MKLLKNEGAKQKIIILLVLVLTINFIVPNYSHAKVDDILVDPVVTFVCWLGDGLMEILQDVFLGENAIIVANYADYRQEINEENSKDAEESGGFFAKLFTKNAQFWGNVPFLGDSIANLQGTIDKLVNGDDGYNGPVILVKYSIAAIVSNKIEAFDINFFNPITESDTSTNSSDDTTEEHISTASILKTTIQKWYVALRNIALVLLLSILVYIGIKIVLSSSAEEKANYKTKIINWIVALCILFSLHYIMTITLYVVDLISNALEVKVISEDGYDTILPIIRMGAELGETAKDQLAYALMYVVLVSYTVIFTFVYLKRTIFIAFLTMFAPLVAVTYPLDKENDGKAQAFDYWIKEYFFNVIMQPIHLLLYYIFITMAIDLVQSNIIYALVAAGFIIPAEKIIRKMFNFEKAGEESAAAGFAGGALFASAFSAISRIGKGGHGGKSDNGSDDNQDDNSIRTTDVNELFGDNDPISVDQISDGTNTALNNINISNSNVRPNVNNVGMRVNNPNNNNNGTHGNNNFSTNINPNLSNLGKGKTKGKIKTNTPKFIRGVKAVGKRTFTGRNLVKVAKGVGKVGLGAAGLTMGAAAGIATGDLGNAIKFGATGATAGWGSVNALSGGVETIGEIGKDAKQILTDEIDEFRIGYNNYTQKEYEQNILIPRKQKENAKNKEIKEKYKREFGNTDLLDSSARNELYKAGITDENLIIEALKVKQENSGLSDKELVKNTVMASKIKSAKDAESREKQLKKILENNGAFRNVEKALENKGAFKDLDRKLQNKYKKIDDDNQISIKDKELAKQNLKQREKDKIIDKEKDRLVSGRMRVIRKISGVD